MSLGISRQKESKLKSYSSTCRRLWQIYGDFSNCLPAFVYMILKNCCHYAVITASQLQVGHVLPVVNVIISLHSTVVPTVQCLHIIQTVLPP